MQSDWQSTVLQQNCTMCAKANIVVLKQFRSVETMKCAAHWWFHQQWKSEPDTKLFANVSLESTNKNVTFHCSHTANKRNWTACHRTSHCLLFCANCLHAAQRKIAGLTPAALTGPWLVLHTGVHLLLHWQASAHHVPAITGSLVSIVVLLQLEHCSFCTSAHWCTSMQPVCKGRKHQSASASTIVLYRGRSKPFDRIRVTHFI